MNNAGRVALVETVAAAIRPDWPNMAGALAGLAAEMEAEQAGARQWVEVNGRRATHYCVICGALWILYPPPDSSWSLASASCGKCCDNVAMGEQIRLLPGLPVPEAGGEPVEWVCDKNPEHRFKHDGYPECNRLGNMEKDGHCAGSVHPVYAAPSPSPGLVEGWSDRLSSVIQEFVREFPVGVPWLRLETRIRAALAAHREGR